MKDDKFFVKPAADDLIVRDPRTGQPLPADGAYKPRDQYWLRRLRDGSVVEATTPAKKPKPASAGKTRAKAAATESTAAGE